MSGHMQDVTPDRPEPPTLVREARERLGLSREGLAFKAGVSLKTIERIERGEGMPHRSTRQVIARVLDVAPEDIFPEPTVGTAA
jgi:transcriptional regulator with XRE-family HTH domain